MSDSAAPWTVARQASLSMGFSRQEYCSGLLPFPPPGDLPDPGIKRASPVSNSLKVDCLPSELLGSLYYGSIQFSRSVLCESLRPRGPQHARPPSPSPTPGACPNTCALSRWCRISLKIPLGIPLPISPSSCITTIARNRPQCEDWQHRQRKTL